MKPKTMVLMAVAVICGLGASYMTSRLLAERTTESPQEVEKVKILVARKSVPQGTYIKEPTDWFVEKEFTLGEEPKKAVRNFDELKDKVLSKPLSAEQWVVGDDLLRKEDSFNYSIPKGMRALTIRVSVDTVVGGFVQPNSRVDVINTVKGGDVGGYTQTILQNMLVLAIDTINKRDPEKVAIVSSNVTLAVTPEEGQVLSLAQQMGELRLSLRPQDDQAQITVRTLKPEDIRTGHTKTQKGGTAADEEPDAPKGLGIGKVPDVGMTDPMTQPSEPPAEPVKRKKPWVLTIINSEQTTKAVFLENEDEDFETQIQKSDAEQPRPNKKPAAQPAPEAEKEKPASPATPAPAPDKPRTGKKSSGS
jgi:pilus assembly protein CpaB